MPHKFAIKPLVLETYTKFMTITEFELQLQAIDPKFSIKQHPSNEELAGVYYDPNPANAGFLITVPSKEISETFNPNHQDSTGHPHNAADKVLFVAQEHLRKLTEEPGYKENWYEPLPTPQKAGQ